MEQQSVAQLKKTFHFKLVLLGDTSVGKSCLVVRFATNEFFELQEPTIGAAFMTQSINIDDYTIKFEIWDTAGAERYRSLAPMYYRGSVAAVVVYDVTNAESFEGAKSWIAELRSLHSPEVVIALAANKIDLQPSLWRVDSSMAREYAEQNNLLFLETSAKTGTNVAELFHEIGRKIPRNRKNDSDEAFRLNKDAKDNSTSSWCPC